MPRKTGDCLLLPAKVKNMWTSYIFRAIISGLIFLWAVWQFIQVEIGNGIFFLLIAALVAGTIWLNEAILLAFLSLRKQNFAKAEKRLNWITKPELMIKGQQAYYYYLKGMIMSQSGQMSKSEGILKKALSLGLRFKHDRAMVKLNLAGIAASKRRKREALNWLSQAKKDDDRKMLTDQIKMMKQQMGRL